MILGAVILEGEENEISLNNYYNPGKKGWDSLSDLVQRGSPLFPNAMLIRVMLPEAAPGRPTLIDGGGEGYDKWGVRRLL